MREISVKAVETWGLEAQMLMVAEEGTEIAHAVLKWIRAYKRYNKKGVALTRENLSDDEKLRNKAYERYLAKKVFEVQKEAMQMLFMIDQLQVMLPGKYEEILEEVLVDATDRLRERGVD